MKAQKLRNILTLVIEPLALGVLAFLFIVPTITVMNLSPITKTLKETKVLGVNTDSSFSLDLVGGKHDIFTGETLDKVTDNTYEYTTKLNKRAADNYSKPVLEIKNDTTKIEKISFQGQTLNQTQSNIGIIVDDKEYKLQGDKGQTYAQEITLKPSEKFIIFLTIESSTDIQFSEDFALQIKLVENL